MRFRVALLKKRSCAGEGRGFYNGVGEIGEICRLKQVKNPNIELKKLQKKFEP